MSSKTKRLIIMAGGTGGHVFPGLVVADYLIAKGWQVRWLGTTERIEADLVPKHGIEIDFIKISGLRGKGLSALFLVPIRMYRAICQAKNIIRNYQPNVVLGMGGYVSGAGGFAAIWCGVPLVIHEQNGIAGLTNSLLAKISKKVLQAFPGVLPNAEVVGNPIRIDILRLPPPQERLSGRQGPIRVLVVGGSQGSQILNQILPAVAAQLGDKVTVWHQVGKGALTRALQIYKQFSQENRHKIIEFIDNIAAAYDWADVVVCRSGALTISEIAAVGLPSILIPFQHKDRQQYWNAVPLEQVGAAKIIEQHLLTSQKISNLLSSWDRKTLMIMANKAKTKAILDATERVADAIIKASK